MAQSRSNALCWSFFEVVRGALLLLFLGLAFLLSYTAERITVSLPLRYAGVAGVGVALLALGWRLRERKRSYALILQGAGIGVFYLTTLSALKIHGLIDPTMGFAFLFAVALLSSVLAILQNSLVLAMAATLEGFAAPVLVSTGAVTPHGLLLYLAVLNVGILTMSWFKAWRPLHLLGLVSTITLTVGWSIERYTPEFYMVMQIALIAFMAMYSAIGLLFTRRTLQDNIAHSKAKAQSPLPLAQRAANALHQVGRIDSALVFGLPVSAFALQYLLVQDMHLGPTLAAVGFGLWHLVLARLALIGQKPGLRLLAEAHAIVAVLFGSLAIPLGLEGQWTGAAWAIEAAGMLWLGLRQDRVYARLFSYVVLFGAATRLLGEITFVMPEPGQPAFQGSWLGPLLLALGAGVMYFLGRKAQQAAPNGNANAQTPTKPQTQPKPQRLPLAPPKLDLDKLETECRQILPWVVMLGLGLLPWLLLAPIVAPAALAMLAVLWQVAARRLSASEQAACQPISLVALGFSVLGLLAVLQPSGADAGGPVLADGWLAWLSTVAIAASMIATMWLVARPPWDQAIELGQPVTWPVKISLMSVVTALLLHLSALFVAPLWINAGVWSLLALLTLWMGLRAVMTPLLVLSGVVQLAAIAYAWGARAGMPLFETEWSDADGSRMAIRLAQVFIALASAAWLHRLGVQRNANLQSKASVMTEPIAWAHTGLMRWLPLIAAVFAWLINWSDVIAQTLRRLILEDYLSNAILGLILLSSVGMWAWAKRRQWGEMGALSLCGIPLVAMSVLPALSFVRLFNINWLPSDNAGWLLWPALLLWHFAILKWQDSRWPLQRLVPWLHGLGLLFFVKVASYEWSMFLTPQLVHSGGWSDVGLWRSGWTILGWVMVVVLTLFALSHPRIQARWPLNAYANAYRWAGMPLAVMLFVWTWGANIVSSGSAAPLPTIPLINPLELGLLLNMAAITLWQRSLPEDHPLRVDRVVFMRILALTGLALLTAGVLRACHHWAGVPWDVQALWDSTLAQAVVSITWALTGVCSMIWANRHRRRLFWMAGASLLGVVVVKLFLVELADSGGIFRIVSFIAVGLLLLLVGYFAPVPDAEERALKTS